nr:PDZ domain-containing protein 11 isoform X3 [Caretta caretta]
MIVLGVRGEETGRAAPAMDSRIPYDDYPVVFLPAYENPPAWIPPHERVYHPDYNNELTQYLPRTIVLKKPPGAQVIPDSDAHRAGLQEGDQVLAVNDVDFQDIEHSKITRGRRREPFTVPDGVLPSNGCSALQFIGSQQEDSALLSIGEI